MRGATALIATLALGLCAGALLAEALLLVPWWRAMSADAFLAWYPEHADSLFRLYAPLEIGAALLAVAALAAGWRSGSRPAFALATGLAAAVLLAFPLYFGAVNASFADGTLPRGEVADELARWAAWNWGRTGLAIAAFAAAAVGLRRSE